MLSDNAYYKVIKDTRIDDPYFTMEVPESFVGQVAYGVELGKNGDGESYLQKLTLFHLPSVTRFGQGEPWQGWSAFVEGAVWAAASGPGCRIWSRTWKRSFIEVAPGISVKWNIYWRRTTICMRA